jgi:hypothetical protein
MMTGGVLFEVRAEFLNNISESLGLRDRWEEDYWNIHGQLLTILLYYVIVRNMSRLLIKPTAQMLGKPRGLLYSFIYRTAG